MGIVLLWATWACGRLKKWRFAILTKLGQHVNRMMAVTVKMFDIF